MTDLLLTHARLIDPEADSDAPGWLHIRDGVIAATGNLMMRQLSPTIVAMIQVAYDHGETRIRYGANLGVPHVAAALAIRAQVSTTQNNIQLHGGIGYTWESGIHAFLKRAALNRSLFGSPAAHRKKLAKRYSTR